MYTCNTCGYNTVPADKIGEAIMTAHYKEKHEADQRRTDRDNQSSLSEGKA